MKKAVQYLVDFGALDFQDLAHEYRPLRDESLLQFYRLIDLEERLKLTAQGNPILHVVSEFEEKPVAK